MASYSTGTVSINIGNTLLTGSATNWGSAALASGWYITFDNSKTWYQIFSIVSNTDLNLFTPYGGAVNISGGSYLAVDTIPLVDISTFTANLIGGLPTSLPASPGILWLNSGVLTVSS